jgi:hypothetical protein
MMKNPILYTQLILDPLRNGRGINDEQAAIAFGGVKLKLGTSSDVHRWWSQVTMV